MTSYYGSLTIKLGSTLEDNGYSGYAGRCSYIAIFQTWDKEERKELELFVTSGDDLLKVVADATRILQTYTATISSVTIPTESVSNYRTMSEYNIRQSLKAQQEMDKVN